MDDNKNSPPEGMGVVYVVRPSSKLPKYPSLIVCDGYPIGIISPMQFCKIDIDSGDHIFHSEVGGSRNKFHLNVKTGVSYFFEVKVQAQPDFILGNLYLRNQLILIDQSDGQLYLERCEHSIEIPTLQSLNKILDLKDNEKNLKELENLEKIKDKMRKKGINLIKPPEGKSVVYIIRPSSKHTIGQITILCDGKYLNMIFPEYYFYVLLDPGVHIFYSEITGLGFSAAVSGLRKLKISTETGKTYFLGIQLHLHNCFFDAYNVYCQLIHLTESGALAYIIKSRKAPIIPFESIYPFTDNEQKQFKKAMKQIKT